MLILGIHFGHDASVSVVHNGVVKNCIERERITRAKHAVGITSKEIELALEDSGFKLTDIDFCACTSTQGIEYLFIDPQALSFKLDLSAPHASYCSWGGTLDENDASLVGKTYIKDTFTAGRDHPYIRRLSDDFRENLADMAYFPSVESFWHAPGWDQAKGLDRIAETVTGDVLSDDNAGGMQLPITANILGREIPGFLLSHHYAHAAYAYYASNFEDAAVFSHDGSLPTRGYECGMYYYGRGNRLYSVAPHYLSIGNLYERIAFILNLGYDTGAGKLMGLAPWGKPAFYDPRFVGNWHDGLQAPMPEGTAPADKYVPDWITEDRHPLLYRWLVHCLRTADAQGYDLEPLGDTDRMLAPINVDLAASTQLLFEEIHLRAVAAQHQVQQRLDCATDNLCLTGGTALSCPTNTRLFNESPFTEMFVPPAVSDGGLSIGAALAVTHNTLDVPRPRRTLDATECAYLGRAYGPEDFQDAIDAFRDRIEVHNTENAVEDAARALAANLVVGWFDGRSETGPRALGHRSILAHPGPKENWERVNRIKKRELWRPFAPVVLEEDAAEYFTKSPIPSPFMLFTADVKTPDDLAAITHADNSARIQTVTAADGRYYEVVKRFRDLTRVPVLMNTSFNGPGEPVVETPRDAIGAFLACELDVLYLADRKIVHKKQ
ncbi:MAG: carbamoyltransferase [Rhodospirillaceae bacterium]|nr:carbamoyltransferase [Magnetovibrio sp.]MAY67257.1 carbamoyltransferase [Rhodospirillaceae bacterium]